MGSAEDGKKIVRVEINFPVPVEPPPGWEGALSGLVDMVCKKYQIENPLRVMWPSGHGAKILWREPEEPDCDPSVFVIDVAEREADERTLRRRGLVVAGEAEETGE